MTEFIYLIAIIAFLAIVAGILKHHGIIRIFLPPVSIPAILYDFAMPFVAWAKMIKARHQLHFACSILVVPFVLFAWYFELFQIRTMGLGWTLLLGWFGCFIVHLCREWWKSYKGGKYPDRPEYGDRAGKQIVEVDWRDVRYGGYGGIFWTYIATVIASLIIK